MMSQHKSLLKKMA